MDITSICESKKLKTKSNSYQYVDAQIALAFQTDCETLLQKFKERRNYSFGTFSEVWKQMCFMAIFQGKENILLLQTFMDNCFFIVKKFLFSDDLFLQTGAIYVLYGLYYKQPIKRWIKIRLTQSDVNKIDEIMQNHKSMHCLDPIFIYNKMRLDAAFEYCALPKPVVLETKRSTRRYDLSNEEIKLRLPKDYVVEKFKNLMEQDPDLVQLEETDEEYRRLAQKYKDKFYVFPSNIGEDLKKVYSQTFQVDLGEPEGEDGDMKKLKNKALMNTNAVYRGERKVVTAMDLGGPSTSK